LSPKQAADKVLLTPTSTTLQDTTETRSSQLQQTLQGLPNQLRLADAGMTQSTSRSSNTEGTSVSVERSMPQRLPSAYQDSSPTQSGRPDLPAKVQSVSSYGRLQMFLLLQSCSALHQVQPSCAHLEILHVMLDTEHSLHTILSSGN